MKHSYYYEKFKNLSDEQLEKKHKKLLKAEKVHDNALYVCASAAAISILVALGVGIHSLAIGHPMTDNDHIDYQNFYKNKQVFAEASDDISFEEYSQKLENAKSLTKDECAEMFLSEEEKDRYESIKTVNEVSMITITAGLATMIGSGVAWSATSNASRKDATLCDIKSDRKREKEELEK